MELRCHVAFSAQSHLSRDRTRELLCSGFGVLRSWDPMVVETWIEIFREKFKHISPLLKLDAPVDAFHGAWMSSVHPLVG
jgi:hypothetical protein